MADRIAVLEKPRIAAKSLSGQYESLLRYRVSDYRVVCEIHDRVLIILVVAVAHRREVYRGTEI